MSIESELAEFIKTRHKSIREFALSIGMSQQGLDAILKRGITSSRVDSMIKICKSLQISLDGLADGEIISAELPERRYTIRELEAIKKFRAISDTEKRMVESVLDVAYNNTLPKEEEKVS